MLNSFNPTVCKCSRSALGIWSRNSQDLVLPTRLTLSWSMLHCSPWWCRDVAQDSQRKRLDLTSYFSPAVKGSGYPTTEQISNSCTLTVPANPGEQVAKPQVFVLQVGRCRPARVPQHGAAGTRREPPRTGGQNCDLPLLLRGMPVPQVKVRSIREIKLAKIFESSEKLIWSQWSPFSSKISSFFLYKRSQSVQSWKAGDWESAIWYTNKVLTLS